MLNLRDPAHQRKLTVFYHGGCHDGIGGAWAVFTHLAPYVRKDAAAVGGLCAGKYPLASADDQLRGAGVVFLGISHGDPAPADVIVVDRHVLYVDIVPSREVASRLRVVAASMMIIDHHRSAEALLQDMRSLPGCPYSDRFDLGLSGAQLAWDWASTAVGPLGPTSSMQPAMMVTARRQGPEPEGLGRAEQLAFVSSKLGGDSVLVGRPPIIDYIGDRDLFTFRLPRSRAVTKAIFVEDIPRGFPSLTETTSWNEVVFDDLAKRGAAYLAYEKTIVGRLVSTARAARVWTHMPGESAPREYSVLAVNTPTLQSEVGEAVMEKAEPGTHFAVMWAYVADRDEIWVSARTNRPDVDLSQIVPHVVGGKNGGGHARAAGFTIAGDRAAVAIRYDPPVAK